MAACATAACVTPVALALVVAVGAVWGRGATVPTPAAVRAAHRPSDVEVLDRNGVLVHEMRADAAQRSLAWVPLGAVSPALRDAIVAAEDRRFATHGGVDPLALASAARERLRGAALRGASTITMQLASLLDRRDGRREARTPAAKWRQMRRAWALERTWTKDEILEAYLNLVPFRGEVSGVGAAAGVLLGKRPHGLAPWEAVVLAVLPRSPNADLPAVRARTTRLAARLGLHLEPARLDEATQLALRADQARRPRVALAPHLARRLLGTAAGEPPAARGSARRSTLDAGLQLAAARLLEEQLRELESRNVRDGAVLVVDNASGDVLAYVGGRGARATARHVDGVRARRQAGSTLKPFLYAAALDERLLTAASLLQDTPLAVPLAGGVYQPRNYDEGFRGLVSVRSALASSLNVPAVRTLDLLSPDAFVARLRTLGFGLERSAAFYGPALALGSAEVSLEELVAAYRAIANGGVWSPLRTSLDGSAAPALSPGASPGARVFSPEAAFVVADVLSDRESRSATFGLENALATRSWAAVKTGTSKEMRDNWCVGFSRRHTVGVWVGNASGEPMHDVSGLAGAAPVWRELMGILDAGAPSEPPEAPAGLVRAAAAFAREAEVLRDEWFLHGTEPGVVAASLAPQRPRIASPQQGSILAIDPDIPRDLQRLALEAHGVGHGSPPASWRLDDSALGSAVGIRLWPLIPGRHRLLLVAEDGRVLDAVAFEVRGGRGAAPAATDGVPPAHVGGGG
ncbi:MAG: penicillin-binding protein 1C [Deltaproteobacteria bacterium]|nr:penicillin-binding protein 1C [Deltaproteobacteria bacterium]